MVDIAKKKAMLLEENSYIQAETFRRKLQNVFYDLNKALQLRPQESRLYEAYSILDELRNEVTKEVDDKRTSLLQHKDEEYKRFCAECDAELAQNLS